MNRRWVIQRRKFTCEFELEAVKLDQGPSPQLSYAQVARPGRCIRRSSATWVKSFADDPQHAFPGRRQMKPKQLEIAHLKHEMTKRS